MKAAFTLAQIITNFGEKFNQTKQATPYIQKTFRAINRCRTASMGGHVDQCSQSSCQHIRISYNSCRNRLGGIPIVLAAKAPKKSSG